MRYAIRLCYLGSNYCGWQKQPNAKTVQESIEMAFSTVLRLPIDLVASGRTDAGVHASMQVAHFDFEGELSVSLFSKVNRLLSFDIALKEFAKVSDDFHARFNATKRAYIYKIHQTKNPYINGQSYYFRNDIDLEKMNLAANYLLGKQDFESFSKVKTDVNTFFCEIFEAKFVKNKDQIEFHICANRFLRGMVRAVVGSLLQVGIGKEKPEWLQEVIVKKDRSAAGRNVAPEGLFLCDIVYTEKINWQKIN